mmetsp:Transcript_17656/g.40882  ORF Transcript_17656/g.40882 Transcript_17656/m.40882 type:complete len:347 (-) Transcript_17656:4330-5370(-)
MDRSGFFQIEVRSKAYVGSRNCSGTRLAPRTSVCKACQSMLQPPSHKLPTAPKKAATSCFDVSFGWRIACTNVGVSTPLLCTHFDVSMLSAFPGPTSSTKAGLHWRRSFSAFSRQRTVPRMCLVQYVPSCNCCADNQPPEKLEATGAAAARCASGAPVSATAPRPIKVSAALATRPEWKAFLMCKRVHFLPAAFRSFSRVEIASTSPEMTAWMGEFTAASHNPGLAPLSTSASSAADHSATESIAPSSAKVSVDLARAATIDKAPSNVSKPPLTAAAYSPSEWPAAATGLMPIANSTCAKAYSTMKRLGCNTVGLANSSSCGPSTPNKMGLRSKPRNSGARNFSQH